MALEFFKTSLDLSISKSIFEVAMENIGIPK